VFQASTNGVPDIHPQRVNYRGAVSPIGPRTCYDEGKRWRRGARLRLPPHHGVEIEAARIFNTYGAEDAIRGCVIADPHLRLRLGAAARERAERFSIHATALACLDAYDFIAVRDPAARPAA
jgi:hypothetical protein